MSQPEKLGRHLSMEPIQVLNEEFQMTATNAPVNHHQQIPGIAQTLGGVSASFAKEGLDPKLRPVNVGCSILKWPMKLALKSPQAHDAISELAPIQQGMKAKHGMEVVPHLFRAMYGKNNIILTTDFSNGFNAFRRQAMLDAVQKRCPALTKLFNQFYGLESQQAI